MESFTPHLYQSADGRLDLFARVYAGDGPALLLMHGLTRNSADFEPLVPHLAGHYRLVVPDQRGRGLSAPDPDPARYRPDIYAADMWALLDGLGVGRCGLIGTSMGGLMAMLMAAAQPERIAAIVLNDIGPKVEKEGLDRIAGYVGPGGAMATWGEAADRCRAINADAFPGFGAADWMAFARRTCRELPDGSVIFAYDPAIASGFSRAEPDVVPPDLWPVWDMESAIPAMVVRGALSDLLSDATVSEMRRRHAGPFEAVTVAGRGHAPLLDEPEVVAALLPFLRRHVG